MSTAIITLTDKDDGCDLDISFGNCLDEASQAHQMAALCLQYLHSLYETRNYPVSEKTEDAQHDCPHRP